MKDSIRELMERIDLQASARAGAAEFARASLTEAEAELRALDASWERLVEAGRASPAAWASAEHVALQRELADARNAAWARWCAHLLAFRQAGGLVELRIPAEASGVFEAAPTSPRPDLPATDPARVAAAQADLARMAVPAALAAVPLDSDRLRELAAALNGERRAGQAEPTPAAELTSRRWDEIAETLGEVPTALDDPEVVLGECRRLLRLARAERMATWRAWPREVQRLLVGQLAARARAVQEPAPSQYVELAGLVDEIDSLFSTLTAFQKTSQPGFVHGLSRGHTPKSGTWLGDAAQLAMELLEAVGQHLPQRANPERALATLETLLAGGPGEEQLLGQLQATLDAGVAPDDPRLVRLMTEHLELLRRHARFKSLRQAIRAAVREDADEAGGEAPARVPDDWPWWSLVRGRRAAIVGGAPREAARARIEQTFGLAELVWEPADQLRQMENLANQARSGSLHLVLLLQSFTSHAVSGKLVEACRDASVPFVPVERGYGIERIRQAIEEHLRTSATATIPSI